MREQAFVRRRQAGWERLETLLARVDRGGVRKLDAPELQDLALSYRSVTTDLAAARSRGYGTELTAYLNRLTARAYAQVHVGTARGGWTNVATFFTRTFPREVRVSRGIIAATTAIFIVTTLVSYWIVARHPANAYALLPDDEIPVVTKSLHDSNFGFDRDYSAEMSSQIITHNIEVSAAAFAGGITTLGVFTVWAIATNGVMLGALGALFTARGFGIDFWATIAPHGVIELTSIQIAGAAGLLCAKAVIAPGRLRRGDALRVAGRRAGTLMLGVAALLCVAGTIEGFISPQRIDVTTRFGVGGLTAVALYGYLTLAGRRPEDELGAS